MKSFTLFQTTIVMLVSLCTHTSLSQEEKQRGVLVQHAEKGKSHLILEGYRVRVFTKDSNDFVGVLRIVDEKSIKVDKEIIALSNITEFRGNDRRRTVGGKTTMLVGGGLLGASVIAFIISGEIEDLSPLSIGIFVSAGLGITTTSIGAALYGDKRNYKKSKGWEIGIQLSD